MTFTIPHFATFFTTIGSSLLGSGAGAVIGNLYTRFPDPQTKDPSSLSKRKVIKHLVGYGVAFGSSYGIAKCSSMLNKDARDLCCQTAAIAASSLFATTYSLGYPENPEFFAKVFIAPAISSYLLPTSLASCVTSFTLLAAQLADFKKNDPDSSKPEPTSGSFPWALVDLISIATFSALGATLGAMSQRETL